MQYTKEQLSSMSVEELRDIAKEFGIKTSKLEQMDLVYEILDKSAIASAADKAAKQTSATKKRTRIKTVDRVYTASQDKAKKVDKTVKVSVDDSLFASLSDEEKDMMKQTQIEEQEVKDVISEELSDNKVQEDSPQKKTRKTKKSKDDVDGGDNTVSEPAESETVKDEPKKKTRKSKKVQEEPETTEDILQPKEDFVVIEMTEDNKEEMTEVNSETSEQSDNESSENLNDTIGETDKNPNSISEQTNQLAFFNNDNNDSADTLHLYNSIEEVPLENGSDFIIIDDIPAEEFVVERNIMELIKGYSNRQPQNNQQTAGKQAAPQAEVSQAQEKLYDFTDLLTVSGVMEVVENYGFLRSSDYNYLVSPDDVYVSQSQVKQYGLKTGDVVEGTIRPPKDGEKFFPLMTIKRINGCNPNVVRDRVSFEYLTPLFPDDKFKLCSGDARDTESSRIVDLFAPIGKGQRALIVAQPKTGKTLLMKDIANSIARNHPDAYLMMLLIDERPEEVTDMARTVNAEVIASTFDAPAENHVKIAGIVLEKAKRMVECGHDVVIFLDSITRLARAYNTVSPASGKVLSGGVDANALQKPKRFFGAARNIENGGSLTIIATALIDTGSKMDEVIFEEFKGTGNMELQLDRTLSNKRVFPAVNLVASSTRRDDLLQDQTTLRRMWVLRKHISDMTPLEAMEFMLQQIKNTKNNDELLLSMNS